MAFHQYYNRIMLNIDEILFPVFQEPETKCKIEGYPSHKGDLVRYPNLASLPSEMTHNG